jgi:hypothetical protein
LQWPEELFGLLKAHHELVQLTPLMEAALRSSGLFLHEDKSLREVEGEHPDAMAPPRFHLARHRPPQPLTRLDEDLGRPLVLPPGSPEILSNLPEIGSAGQLMVSVGKAWVERSELPWVATLELGPLRFFASRGPAGREPPKVQLAPGPVRGRKGQSHDQGRAGTGSGELIRRERLQDSQPLMTEKQHASGAALRQGGKDHGSAFKDQGRDEASGRDGVGEVSGRRDSGEVQGSRGGRSQQGRAPSGAAPRQGGQDQGRGSKGKSGTVSGRRPRKEAPRRASAPAEALKQEEQNDEQPKLDPEPACTASQEMQAEAAALRESVKAEQPKHEDQHHEHAPAVKHHQEAVKHEEEAAACRESVKAEQPKHE